MRTSCRALVICSLIFSAILFASCGVASADTLLSYQFVGPVSASFELPVNPNVTVFDLGFGFQVTPIDLTINGVASSDFLVFFNASAGGAFGAFSSGSSADLNLAGPQLYTGPESAPTMLQLSGTALTDFASGAPAGTISASPVSTPEVSVFSLLAVGILALGIAVISVNRAFPSPNGGA
jgi:hypothetical protein